ncbi:hypothetical protein Tco_1130260 [Tanacetum coccineum]
MAAAVWCKAIIVHYHHIAVVTVAVSQLSRTHGGSESLKWVAIRWEATSPAVVQQRTRHFEDHAWVVSCMSHACYARSRLLSSLVKS